MSQIPRHKVEHWIHRKFKHVTVIRETSYGYGDSFPCQCCRKSLERLDIRVTSVFQGKEISERMTDCKIKSKQTLGQQMKRQPEKGCVVMAGHVTRRTNQYHTYG